MYAVGFKFVHKENGMKKLGKSFALLILLLSFAGGGFLIGLNMNGQGTINGQDQENAHMDRIVENIRNYESVIKKNFIFDYKDKDLEYGIYKGLFAGLKDPYSEYYTPEEFKRLLEDTSGKFAGVGLVVTAGEDDLITVVSPIDGTPAAKAGIKTGDKIIAVDGITYMGSDLSEAVAAMRGEVKTEVELTVRTLEDGKNKSKSIKLIRDMISVDSVSSKMLDNKIGYISITSFDENTDEDFIKELDKLTKEGARGLVLDLRNNPGGLLDSCIKIADQLLGKYKIVTTVDKEGNKEVSESDAKANNLPMTVLGNGGSASASEILIGALKDNKRAKFIGKKTFGKGIVQRLYPLGPNGEDGGFKLTMAEYLTPSGKSIHKKGIEPDIKIELTKGTKAIGPQNMAGDNQLKKAITELEAEIKK